MAASGRGMSLLPSPSVSAERAKAKRPGVDYGERAVLMQLRSHVEALKEYASGVQLRQPLGDMPPGSFGENLFVDGGASFCADTICLGDEFQVVRNGLPTGLRLQVSSPRHPCNSVDRRHGGTFNKVGIRAQCARSGYAGVFLRVLSGGDLAQGDALVLVSRPRPSWSLARVCRLCFANDVANMKVRL